MASSRELQLEATATIEDATSKLQDLLSSIKDLPQEISTKINLDSETAESQVESIKSDIEDVPDEVTTTIDVDGDAESQIADIKSEIETIEDTVSVTIDANDNASDIADNIKSTVEDLDGQITNITLNADGDALDIAEEVKSELEELDGSTATVTINAEGGEQVSEQMDDVTDSTYEATDAAATLSSAGIDAWLYKMVTGAGDYEDTMSRLQVIMNDTGLTSEEFASKWSNSIQTMKDNTGRGAGDIRGYLIDMGLTGVQNQQILTDMFSGVAGASFETGKSIDEIDSALSRVIVTGRLSSRQLMAFKISEQDIFNATGMSLDEFNDKLANSTVEQRAQMMSQVLNYKYAQDANEGYKNSFQKSVDDMGRSASYLTRVLGAPLIEGAKQSMGWLSGTMMDIAKGFAGLPSYVQLFISSLIALGAAIGSLYGISTTGAKILDKLGITDSALKTVKGWWGKVFDYFKDGIKKIADFIKSPFDGAGKKGTYDMFFNEDSGRWEMEENRIKTFINDIKTKIEEIKGKFKLSDIFGGDGETTFIDTVKTKIENLVNTIKTKWETLKGKIKLSDIFGDEKGTIDFKFFDDIPSKLDEVLSKMKVKLPSFENIGKEIPEYLGRGIRSTLNTLVSDGAFVIIAMFQAMYDAAENWRSPIQDQIKDIFLSFDLAEWIIDSLGLGDLWDKIKLPHTTAAKLLGLDKIAKMTPEELWSYIIGDDLATKVGDFLKRDISDPLHEFVNNLLKNPIGLFSSWLKGEKIPAENLTRDIINTIKSNIDGFKDWLNTLEFPNLLDLILPQTASAAGEGKDKGNPIDTAINSIKSKINGFKDWLGSLKFSSITDLIFGKQEEGKESPITTFINDIKAKIGGFKDWLGSLKFTNILDTIFGKKSDQKEDPATTFINGIKTKLNDLKTYVQNKANEIKSALTIDWSKIETGLNEAKQWVMDRWNEIKTYLKTKIDEIKSLINIPWEKIYDGLQGAVDVVNAIWDNFSARMEVLGTKAKKWGADIVQGLINGITNKIPSLEDALNYIKNYFPTSPPKKGPLADVTAEGAADWINNALISPLANAIVGFNDYLREVMPSTVGYWRPDTSYTPPPGSLDTFTSGKQLNNSIDTGGKSGWEQTPISDWTSNTITDWTSSSIKDWTSDLLDSSSALNDFTNTVSDAQLGYANFVPSDAQLGYASFVPSGAQLGYSSYEPSNAQLGYASFEPSGAKLGDTSFVPSGAQLGSEGSTHSGHGGKEYNKMTITFQSGAFQFGDGDKNTVKQAITDALTNPTTQAKMRMQMRMKGYNPRTTIN